ncbi:hypothetical protein TWF696_007657 [Orbilia brochopaga]|uniref:Dynamin N-terminal domain-containing protein n=1 Tax=Orbilia brochopaga TaxID=3140254 RepID=A0AAV9UPI6_9PEZI
MDLCEISIILTKITSKPLASSWSSTAYEQISRKTTQSLDWNIGSVMLTPTNPSQAGSAIGRVSSELIGGETLRERFEKCKRWITDVEKKVFGTVKLQHDDTYAQSIRKDIGKFMISDIESNAMVGLLGEVGSGKSTLINALLDVGDFVPTSRYGVCAPVVLKFAKPLPGMPKYFVEVEYFSREDMEEEARLLWLEMLSDVTNSQHDYEEPSSKEGKAARMRFQHLFPDTNLDSHATLRKRIAHLYGTHKYLQDTCQTFDPGSQRECAKVLQQLLISPGETKPNEAEMWTIIKCIRVYLDAHVLSSGAILVDIPGLDNPSARATISQEYIARSQELIVVVSDQNLMRIKDHEPPINIGYEGLFGIDGRGRATIAVTFLGRPALDEAMRHLKRDACHRSQENENEHQRMLNASSDGLGFEYVLKKD